MSLIALTIHPRRANPPKRTTTATATSAINSRHPKPASPKAPIPPLEKIVPSHPARENFFFTWLSTDDGTIGFSTSLVITAGRSGVGLDDRPNAKSRTPETLRVHPLPKVGHVFNRLRNANRVSQSLLMTLREPIDLIASSVLGPT